MSAIPHIAANDDDASETREWLDALEAVLEREGPERAHFLLEALIDKARREGAHIPYSANTAYLNTIPPHLEEPLPGDAAIEERIRSYIRWNAMVMVVAGQPRRGRPRRPHRQLRVGQHADGDRVQPLLARADRGLRRRPDLLPGPLARRASTRARSWRAASPRSS